MTITATDDKAESGAVTFSLTVNNVAPIVNVDAAQDTSIAEGDTSTALFDFTDRGWADTYSSTLLLGRLRRIPGWHHDGRHAGPAARHRHGELEQAVRRRRGLHSVRQRSRTTTEERKRQLRPCASPTCAPTATIDLAGTTLINGVPTFVANEGVPVPFKGRSTDPGSDDLTL